MVRVVSSFNLGHPGTSDDDETPASTRALLEGEYALGDDGLRIDRTGDAQHRVAGDIERIMDEM